MQGWRNEFKSSGSKSGKLSKLTGFIASNLKNLVVQLYLSQKLSGSMEPLEPPLTLALISTF